jgi:hypothetical protein
MAIDMIHQKYDTLTGQALGNFRELNGATMQTYGIPEPNYEALKPKRPQGLQQPGQSTTGGSSGWGEKFKQRHFR